MMFVVVLVSAALASDDIKGHEAPSEVVRVVCTTLDHLTVIEFGEPVAMAAAGSPNFQIERREDKVFIKPLRAGASTDLFVWTATRHFTFELSPPGEVKKMNSFIDVSIPRPAPVVDNQEQLNQTADMMLTRAFLGAERIESRSIKNANNRVTVRIERVFQSKTTFYIHYSVMNRTGRPYRLVLPVLIVGTAVRPAISLTSLSGEQIDQETFAKLGELKQRNLEVVRSEITKVDLGSGESAEGVVAVREQMASPTLVQLNFGPTVGLEGTRQVQATLVY
jgi:hypothetical protein